MNAITQLLSLGRENDSSRPYANFSLKKHLIAHTGFCEATRLIAEIHSRGQSAGIAEGLLIVGQTGSGKSTILEHYESRFPRREEAGITKIPVLRIRTPDSPSVKSLATEFLLALGDLAAMRGQTTNEKTRRILHYLRMCEVEQILLDEFQHFHDSRRVAELRNVADWLKNLFNESGIPIVLAGLPSAVSVLNDHPQLRRRFAAPYHLALFTMESEFEQRTARAILKCIHDLLPLPCPELHEANLARRFMIASGGCFGYIAAIIDRAVANAPDSQKYELTLDSFATAFQEKVWRDAPAKLNPFHENSLLRPLDHFGEPFFGWRDTEKAAHMDRPRSTKNRSRRADPPQRQQHL